MSIGDSGQWSTRLSRIEALLTLKTKSLYQLFSLVILPVQAYLPDSVSKAPIFDPSVIPGWSSSDQAPNMSHSTDMDM